jgi:hypothetical protein
MPFNERESIKKNTVPRTPAFYENILHYKPLPQKQITTLSEKQQDLARYLLNDG